MKLTVTGRHVAVTEAIRTDITDRKSAQEQTTQLVVLLHAIGKAIAD